MQITKMPICEKITNSAGIKPIRTILYCPFFIVSAAIISITMEQGPGV